MSNSLIFLMRYSSIELIMMKVGKDIKIIRWFSLFGQKRVGAAITY